LVVACMFLAQQQSASECECESNGEDPARR